MFSKMVAVSCCIVLTLSCYANEIPDSTNEWLRHQERERIRRTQQDRMPDVRLQNNVLPAEINSWPITEHPCSTISRITLTGDATKQFQFALKAVTSKNNSVIGHCLGTQGINAVLSQVQNAIIRKGFLTTRVLIAHQDLRAGELKLTLIPGRVHSFRFETESNTCETLQTALPINPGSVLNLRDIEQGLENFKRIPTVEANIDIAPAYAQDASPGESSLIIHHKQSRPFRLNLTMDDDGSKVTGKYQAGLTFSYDNTLGLNDILSLSFSHDLHDSAQGTRGHTINYSIPFGYWLLGLNNAQYHYYQTVAASIHPYFYSGISNNTEIKLSRLIYRDAARKTTASMRTYLKQSNNFMNDLVVENQRRRLAGWEAALSHREFLGKNILDLGITYRHGTGAFGAISAPEELFGEGTAQPIIITMHAMFSIPFKIGPQILNYSGTWRAQQNNTALISQDKFAIGGRSTIRGFDGESVLSSERGWLIRNDIALPLSHSKHEIYLGLDYGALSGPTAELLVGKRLAGTALGLRGSAKGFFYDVFAGLPIYKPQDFHTPHLTTGFNVGWNY